MLGYRSTIVAASQPIIFLENKDYEIAFLKI